jgi:hypothetical protein
MPGPCSHAKPLESHSPTTSTVAPGATVIVVGSPSAVSARACVMSRSATGAVIAFFVALRTLAVIRTRLPS